MTVRVAVAGLFQESNSFNQVATDVSAFAGTLLRGSQLVENVLDRNEVSGMVATLLAAGVRPVPLMAAWASSGGAITRRGFEILVGEMEMRLRETLPLDGVLLSLHGALVVEDEPDGDGEIIERMRRVLGAGAPIGISLDLHAHVTPRMLQEGCFLIGYQTFPHVDMYETGVRVATQMVAVLEGKPIPVMVIAKRQMVLSPTTARTTDGPLRTLVEQARAFEDEARLSGERLDISIFPVQPWIDVPDIGFAVLACGPDRSRATEIVTQLADAAWASRYAYEPTLVPLEQAIAIGLQGPGLTVISDGGDAPTSGSAADHAAVLRALIDAGADVAPKLTYLSICDPVVAAAAHKVGPGSALVTRVGHHYSTALGTPIEVTATVESLSDGLYAMRDQELSVNMGPTAVLKIGSVRLLVRSFPAIEWDVGMYVSQGLDPRVAQMVFVKSPAGFRNSYAQLADRIVVADTPGSAPADIRRLPYTRVTRPLFPLDPL